MLSIGCVLAVVLQLQLQAQVSESASLSSGGEIYKINSVDNNAALSYDIDTAITLAYYSQASYCPDENVATWNCAYCKQLPQMTPLVVLRNDTTDSHGFIGYDKKANMIVIAFRGTEDLGNWITDLNGFDKADLLLPYCYNENTTDDAAIHQGFNDAYISLRDQVHRGLAAAVDSYPNAKVIITGHSLGAALATLCGLDLSCSSTSSSGHVDLSTAVIYNYGSPRLGNAGFQSAMSALRQRNKIVLWRNTHWRDIIPHLPLEDMLGYEHSPTEVFLQEVWDNTYHICDGSGEDKNCADQFHVPSVADHLLYYNISMSSTAC